MRLEKIKEDNWYIEWKLKDNNGDVLVTTGWTRLEKWFLPYGEMKDLCSL